MILTRAQALQVSKRSFVTINVPELDGDLRLASLSAGPSLLLNDFKDRMAKGEAGVGREMMVTLMEMAVVDESGEQLFDHASAAAFLDRISPETMQLISAAVPKSSSSAPLGNSVASPVAG